MSPGRVSIIGKLFKKLLRKSIILSINIFNAILEIRSFPWQWKVVQVIMILKPDKHPIQLSSSRQINLLLIISKVFEKLLLFLYCKQFLTDNNIFPGYRCSSLVRSLETRAITDPLTLSQDLLKYLFLLPH